MIIKEEFANEILKKAQENFKKAGISVNPKVMERFENTVSEIAQNKPYKEGDPINERDLTRLANEAGLVLGDFVSGKGKSEKAVGSLMILTDYLYAVTMQRLGSPNIPASFGAEMKKSIVKFATGMESKASLNQAYMFPDSIYNQQRGKNADDLRDELSTLLSAAENGNPTPSQIQTLVAEYQALQKRQSNHGFFWRLFHSSENAERNELLSNMESALKYVLGNNVNLMKSGSLFLAEKVLEQNIEGEVSSAFADDGMCNRIGASAEAFGESDIEQNDITQELRAALIEDLSHQTEKKTQITENEIVKAQNKENAL